MKTILCSLGPALVAGFTLWLFPASVKAQGNSVSITTAEFQQLVYVSHLSTELDRQPEVEAALAVLLEMHRRNPNADPLALSGLLLDGLGHYRTNAPTRFLHQPWSDEILAGFLEGLGQVPQQVNFTPSHLSLLKSLINRPNAPLMDRANQLHAGNQRLLTTEIHLNLRQQVVDACLERAQSHPDFALALENLLYPQIQVSLDTPPDQILMANPELGNSPAMQELVRLSQASGHGGLTISTNALKSLFTTEMQVMHQTIVTNRAVHLAISQSQVDHLAYLSDQALIDANAALEAQVKAGQPRRISASHASIQALSSLVRSKNSDLARGMQSVGDSLASFSRGLTLLNLAGGLSTAAASGNFVMAGMQIFSLFLNTGPSPDEIILKEIGQVKEMIEGLRTEMHDRFDRVDFALNDILDTLSTNFHKIDLQLGELSEAADSIRVDLLNSQTDLHRLERELFDYLDAAFRRDFILALNQYLAIEETYGIRLCYFDCELNYFNPESLFYTWSFNNAKDNLSSYWPAPGDLTDPVLFVALNARPLESNLNYVKEFLNQSLELPQLSNPKLASPRDWFVAAQAYLQLAVENPLYFRRVNESHLNAILANGLELESFYRKLTWTGSGDNLQVNRDLYAALLNYYAGKLLTFLTEVQGLHQQYAFDHQLPFLESWRQWEINAPRVTTLSTELLPLPSNPRNAIGIAAGENYTLALLADGTVAPWGYNTYGQCDVPEGLSNVVALAARSYHSLALKADGTVVAWGGNYYGQSDITNGLNDAVAVATSGGHSLAVRANGTVVASGDNRHGQSTIPVGLSNVVAVAAGNMDFDSSHSLALKADGTVMSWGAISEVPDGLTNVTAIAAGDTFNLALKADGIVVAWGSPRISPTLTNTPPDLTNVVGISASRRHSMAVRADGKVICWGENEGGECEAPMGLSNVVAVAAGYYHSVALRQDGTIVTWADTTDGQNQVPTGLTAPKMISVGSDHVLALDVDGTVFAWGDNTSGACDVPAELTSAQTIAAGGAHSMALRPDSTVVAWGWNSYGQTNVPGTLTNVVSLAAGSAFSMALKTGGTVLAWGNNTWGQTNVPIGLNQVVAIDAGDTFGLALKDDGRVVGWGKYFNGSSRVTMSIPSNVSNVVALAAGGNHALALNKNGNVLGWGWNGNGQTDMPDDLDNVVAIAAAGSHSMALTADGTLRIWGFDYHSQSYRVGNLTNIVNMAAGRNCSFFLTATSLTNRGTPQARSFVRGFPPSRVFEHLGEVHDYVLTRMDVELDNSGNELSGAKALIQAVLDLGLSQTMETDDVLHGFIHGKESLGDFANAHEIVLAEINRLQNSPESPSLALDVTTPTRLARFEERLGARLDDLEQTGHPEIPRLVGHTVRMLGLLREAWDAVPPPALEIYRPDGPLELILYGEPHAHYTLQESTNLIDWIDTALTNVQSGIPLPPPADGSSTRFYRAAIDPLN